MFSLLLMLLPSGCSLSPVPYFRVSPYSVPLAPAKKY
jgi:hypothetical protein